jgi:NRPS condensation-like uncharacterized protein
MRKQQFFNASIVDELAHLMERPHHTSLTQGWTFTLEGNVDSGAIREALDVCLTLYPKLKCTMTREYPSLKRAFRYCWEYQEDMNSNTIFREVEDLHPEHAGKDILSCYTDHHASHYVNITRETPVKVLLVRLAGGRSNLIFFVHHAAVDGIGFLIFFQSFAKLYEDMVCGRKKEPGGAPDFDGISKPHMTCALKHFLPRRIYLRAKYGVLKDTAQVACQNGGNGKGSVQKLLAIARELPPQQFGALRASAKALQVTINDYLLASMFQTVKKWNERHHEPPGRIYLDIPVNLRSPDDHTIGNIMGGFRLFLHPEEIGTREETLQKVKEKRSFMMENDIAQVTAEAAWALRPMPLWFKNLLYCRFPEIYCPTLTMSNIGICNPNPSHQDEDGYQYLGAARISNICFIGYAAPWPQLIALTYNNCMTISLSVFRSRFSTEAAGQFLDSFIGEINRQA